jgi:hypothetical protein
MVRPLLRLSIFQREGKRETERKRQTKTWERIWTELVDGKKGSKIIGDSKGKEAP